jgi:hypothetical protein
MGGYCPGGRERPVAKPGFYMSNTLAEVFVKCQIADACVGQDMCADGYEGYKCGDCSLQYYRSGSKCEKCGEMAILIFYGCAAGLVVFLFLTFWVSYKPPLVLRLASLRIGWSFIQITALYAQFDLNWPPEVRQVYKALSFVILDIQITSPECSLNSKLDFYTLLIVKMVMPVVFVVVMFLIYLFSTITLGCFRCCCGDKKKKKKTFRGPSVYKFLYYAMVRANMVLLVMFYVPLVQFVLQYFDCTWQDDGSWSLDAQPSIKCYEGKHQSFFPLVMWGTVAYIIGIPLFAARVLFSNKERLLEPQIFARYGFLFARFKPKYFYWEVILLIRMAILVMCLIMVSTHVPIQTMTGITVLYVASLQQKDYKPFVTDYLNKLETLSLSASVLTLLAGQVFYAGVSNPLIVTLLTALVLLLLVANILVVVVILILEWRPPEDPYKEFNEAITDTALDEFEGNAGGLVVTMDLGADEVDKNADEDMKPFNKGYSELSGSNALFETNIAGVAAVVDDDVAGLGGDLDASSESIAQPATATFSSPASTAQTTSPAANTYAQNAYASQGFVDANAAAYQSQGFYNQMQPGYNQGYANGYNSMGFQGYNSQSFAGNDTQMGTQMNSFY